MSPSLARQIRCVTLLLLSLLGGMLVLGLMAAPALAGTASKRDRFGDVKSKGLTAKERRALDIVSVTAVGNDPFGVIVTVRFKGNLERAIGRGHLKRGLVALALEPKSSSQRPAIVVTRARGHFGQTLRRTKSPDVLVRRSGRKVTFYVFGAGLSNVRRIHAGSFAEPPGPRRGRRPTSSQLLLDLIAIADALLDDDADDEGDLGASLQPRCADVRKELARLRAQEEPLAREYDRAVDQRRRATAARIEESLDKLRAEIEVVKRRLAECESPEPERTCTFDHSKTGSDRFLVLWQCDQAHSSVLFDFSAGIESIDPSVGNAQPPVCQIDASDTSLVRCNGSFQGGEGRLFSIKTTTPQSCPGFSFFANVDGTAFAQKPCSG